MMSHVEPTALGYCYYSNAQSRKLSNLMEKVNIRKQNHRDYLLLGILAYAPHLHYSVFGLFSIYLCSPFSELYNIRNWNLKRRGEERRGKGRRAGMLKYGYLNLNLFFFVWISCTFVSEALHCRRFMPFSLHLCWPGLNIMEKSSWKCS